MDGEEPTETDLHDAVEHAADAVEFVDQVEANAQLQVVYDEYLLSPELVSRGSSVILTGCSLRQTPTTLLTTRRTTSP